MTKLQLILSIIPVLAADVLFSVWYVKKYKPAGKEGWKHIVWIIDAMLIILLTSFLASKWWHYLCLIPSIALCYMNLKNILLGLIWHRKWCYLGNKGFDKWIQIYFQNGKLLSLSLAIAALVFSGLFRYVEPKKKKQ